MKSFLDRFKYAISGLMYMMQERNIRLHIFFGLLVVAGGFIFRLNLSEWLWIMACIVFVITAEIINTLIESLVDEISLERKESLKRIKDMAAGMVLVVSLFALFVGLVIFMPKVWEVFLWK